MSGRVPRVSVCISAYNRSYYLRRAIESVLAQTYTDFELIVSDDCSPDATPDVVAEYRDPRLRYHRSEQNVGMVANYNRCLLLARGEFIGILDDDDEYLPPMLETTVQALSAHPDAGFVYAVAEEIDSAGRPVGLRRSLETDVRLEPCEAFVHLLGTGRVPQPTTLIRSSAISRVGRYDPAIGAWCDADMWQRLARHYAVLYVNRVLSRYRVSDDSITGTGEISGQAATYLRQVLVRALAHPPEGCRLPLHLTRRARREVARYELSIAYGLLARGDAAGCRRHTRAALALAPELIIFPVGLSMALLAVSSLIGAEGPQLLRMVHRLKLGALNGTCPTVASHGLPKIASPGRSR